MPIIKIQKHRGFAQIPNETLRDKRLGLDTRGFLCEVLSYSGGFEASVEKLLEHFSVGRDKLLRMTRELKGAGYLETPGTKDEAGQFTGKIWVFFDIDQTVIRESRTTEKPDDIIQEEKYESPLLRKDAKDASPAKPDIASAYFKEMKAELANTGESDESAGKMLGRLFRKYGRDLVCSVYEESRDLILKASDPYPYLVKILEEEKDKTPEQRAAEQELRKAQWFHRALYQNCEFTPAFEAKRYVTRFPLIAQFIEPSEPAAA